MSATEIDVDDWDAMYGDDDPPKEVVHESILRIYDEWCRAIIVTNICRNRHHIIEELGSTHLFVVSSTETNTTATIRATSMLKALISVVLTIPQLYSIAMLRSNRDIRQFGPSSILMAIFDMADDRRVSIIDIDKPTEVRSVFETSSLTKAAVKHE